MVFFWRTRRGAAFGNSQINPTQVWRYIIDYSKKITAQERLITVKYVAILKMWIRSFFQVCERLIFL